MAVEVLSWVRQLSRALRNMSLTGDGILVRLRSGSIALLGVTTAVGLGLIVFISQLGFPGVLSGPIPSGSAETGTIDDAIALTDRPSVEPLRGHGRRVVATVHTSRAPRSGVDTCLGGAHRLAAASPDVSPQPTAPQPPSAPAPEPAAPQPQSPPSSKPEGQQVSPAPLPAPQSPPTPTAVAESPPTPSPDEHAKRHWAPKPKWKGSSPGKSDKGRGPFAPEPTDSAPEEPEVVQEPETPDESAEQDAVDIGKSGKWGKSGKSRH
jgi:hypothetical protein